MSAADVHAFVSLDAASPGEHTYDLHVRVPRDVEVVQVIPSQFRISFDNRATRRVGCPPPRGGGYGARLPHGQRASRS